MESGTETPDGTPLSIELSAPKCAKDDTPDRLGDDGADAVQPASGSAGKGIAMSDSTGKVAIVTGAGRGIGAATARELASRGYRLALMSPSDSALTLAERLGAMATRGSTAEAADLETLVETALTVYGRIDAVVYSTGSPAKGALLDLTDEDWRRGFDLVLLGVIRLARLVTPAMLRQGGGAWVNISTATALEPSQRFPVSTPMRAGLAAFAKLYADRYAADGIRMNNLLPGAIDSQAHGEERRLSIPMRRIGTVGEVAATATFLLSEGAGYITGQNLVVDGGATRHV